MSLAGSVRAQAKVNLALQVLAREESGYHQIETLFCRLDLADEVRVTLVEDGTRSLVVDGPTLPADGLGAPEANLAWRAAAAFLDRWGPARGFRIELRKHIPVGGGLGGGSADAGGVLRVLSTLTGDVPVPEVMELAGWLGADVPFLTQELSPLALGWGRGDRLFPLPALPARECVLVTAPFGVNTAAAYRELSAHVRGAVPAGVFMGGVPDWRRVASVARNAFEPTVFATHPALSAAAGILRGAAGANAIVLMSGSGSTLFAIPADGETIGPVEGLPAGFSVTRTRTAVSVAPVTVA